VNYSPSAAIEEFFAVHPEEVYLFWKDAGKFLVRRGCEIVVEPAPAAVDQVLRLFILGPALALLLHQRGRLVLHASSVVVAGGVVAFLGESGWGKSTMAAALHSRGHSLVADDVTAVQVEVDNGSPTVVPGFPQMKLWPESITTIGDIPETLPRVEPDWDKRAHRVDRGFSSSPVPLHRIYVLAEGQANEVEPLGPQVALVELIRHTYAAALLDTMGTSQHFLQCATIVNKVPIARLRRSWSLSTLPDVAGLVEEDAEQNAERVSTGCSENSSSISSNSCNTRALTEQQS
jgi:hypothetical protein